MLQQIQSDDSFDTRCSAYGYKIRNINLYSDLQCVTVSWQTIAKYNMKISTEFYNSWTKD